MWDATALKRLLDRLDALFVHLPPRTQDRLWQILFDYGVPPGAEKPAGVKARWENDLLTCRASVVHEKRSDGSRFWRLYIESESGENLERKRVYVGKEGGPELREAIRELRAAYFGHLGESLGIGPCKDQPEWLRKVKAALNEYAKDIHDQETSGPLTVEEIIASLDAEESAKTADPSGGSVRL